MRIALLQRLRLCAIEVCNVRARARLVSATAVNVIDFTLKAKTKKRNKRKKNVC